MKKQRGTPRTQSYYLAGAIRGDTSYRESQDSIRAIVERYGVAYTERSERYLPLDPYMKDDSTVREEKKIFKRDMEWLRDCRAVIAEISGPSTGTGAEIILALHMLKPVLCLYHKSSLPSLMILQNTHKNLIVQEYVGKEDLEAYLTCFLELVRISDDMSEIRRVYFALNREMAQSNLQASGVPQLALSLLKAGRHPAAIESESLRVFKEKGALVNFMFRNIVLQTRWDRLGSQRIGRTFVSGNKCRILNVLVQYTIDELRNLELTQDRSSMIETKPGLSHRYARIDLGRIYQRLREEKLGYSRWAFNKNLRAYRHIGLLLTTEGIRYGGTKLKDQVEIVGAFGDIRLVSSSSRKSKMSPRIRVANHLFPLVKFLEKHGQQSLIGFLMKCRKKDWYPKIAERMKGAPLDIDQIDIAGLLSGDEGSDAYEYLDRECTVF